MNALRLLLIVSIPFVINAVKAATVEEIAEVAPRQKPVSTPDPGCDQGTCQDVCATLPAGSSAKRVTVFVKETSDTNWFGPCPVKSGFLDCAAIPRGDIKGRKDFGWIRGVGASFLQSTSPSGVRVCWKVINWAEAPRNVKLVVEY